MIESIIVDEIMQSPEAPIIASELQHRLQQEQEKRQAFYDSLSAEEHKVEFINGEVEVQVLRGLCLPIPAFFEEREAQEVVGRLLTAARK